MLALRPQWRLRDLAANLQALRCPEYESGMAEHVENH